MYKLDMAEAGVGVTLNDMFILTRVRKWRSPKSLLLSKGTKVYFEKWKGGVINKIVPLDANVPTTEYDIDVVASDGGIKTASGIVLVGQTRYKVVNEVYGLSKTIPYTDTPINNKILKDFEDQSKMRIEDWQNWMTKMYVEEIEKNISKIKSGMTNIDLNEYFLPPNPPPREHIAFQTDMREHTFVWDYNDNDNETFKTIHDDYIKVTGNPDIYVEIINAPFN